MVVISEDRTDDLAELVALAWLGRGNGALNGPQSLRSAVEDAPNTRTAAYLMGIPLPLNRD